MDGATVLCWTFFAIFVGGLALIILVQIISDRLDTYKGVRHFSRLVKDEMDSRWIHHRCLAGCGTFCEHCRKYGECYKECEAYMKRVIDAEQESEVSHGNA